MKDYKAAMKKLRRDAADAALIRDLTTDPVKRETFNRLHEHLDRLADEIEQSLSSMDAHQNSLPIRPSKAVEVGTLRREAAGDRIK